MIEGLDQERPLSLYIHVPFCASKCSYCAFYSLPLSSAGNDAVERYTDFIKAEISALSREWKKPYHTVFIGGGNPGILGYRRLKEMLSIACENGKPEEVTIEINPENVNDEIMMLDGLLTRVSVGIQSLDEKTLRTLGRNASAEAARKALSVLSGLPFDFNADIITAVPGQSIGSSLHDIEEIASYGPGHISLYCLTFEEGTPLARQLVPLDGDEEADFLTSCWKLLGELGYRHYEISNFAKPGKECLHNKVYWNLGQYIGFGPGAESSVGYRKAVSMRDSDTLDGFLRRPEQTVSFLSEDETEEEYLLVSLRTASGIQKREYGERFSHSFDQRYGAFIDKLEKDWYMNDDDHFSLTEAGFLFLDRIILELAMAI